MSSIPAAFLCPITLQVMQDPVMDPDGNSYERIAIEAWIDEHGTSPITRRPLRRSDLAPNRSLRAAIEAVPVTDTFPAEELAPAARLGLELGPRRNDGTTLISVVPPLEHGTDRVPADLCCVIDVSGSMDSLADIKVRDANGNEMVESSGLTVLDVVQHALRTIVAAMGVQDRLALVTFSNDARTDLPPTVMDAAGRALALDCIGRMQASGATNLWAGLRTGIDLLRSRDRTQHRTRSLFLLTDGQPNHEPPRGSVAMLQQVMLEHRISFPISLFGFGYNLDSVMLHALARHGRGQFAFIPDAGMVGTVFVHALANLATTFSTDCRIQIHSRDGTGTTSIACDGLDQDYGDAIRTDGGLELRIGCVQYGQRRDFLVRNPNSATLSVTVTYQAWNAATPDSVTVTDLTGTDQALVTATEHRLSAVRALHTAMLNSSRADQLLDDVISAIRHSGAALSDLIQDLDQQSRYAFRPGWFETWGRHYAPSVGLAHARQLCNNFKDPGVQRYGGRAFRALRDQFDTIFNQLPVVVPNRRAAVLAPGSGHPVAAAPISMSRYNNAGNPCFAGDGIVTMAGGRAKRVDHIVRGDELGNGARVVCVVETRTPGGAGLVRIRGLDVTPWHPVRDPQGGVWTFPARIGEVRTVSCPAVYSFVLDSVHIIEIGGVEAVTLGHHFHDEVRGHAAVTGSYRLCAIWTDSQKGTCL